MPQPWSTWLDRRSLLLRMGLLNGVFVAGIVAFIWVAHQALQLPLTAADRLARLEDARRYAQDLGRLNDNLRADLYAAMLGPARQSGGMRQSLESWQAAARKLRDELDREASVPLPPAVQKAVVETRQHAEELLIRGEELVKAATRDGKANWPLLPAFEERLMDLGKKLDGVDAALSDGIATAKADASGARESADRLIFWGAALIIGVGTLLASAITASIRRSVGAVSAVARALADGNLDVRYEKATGDEIGMIGASLNALAQSLARTLQRMRVDAEHERFSKDLTEAFELAESERAVATVAARAMQTIAAEQPMELLLADAGAVELTRVAQHPTAGSPGCAVRSPSSCVAVRRGSTVTYSDSEQLNVCPYLRGRRSAALAATCVPLSFMGKSLGVLHATSPSDTPFSDVDVANLKTLAYAAATRTGTVRAFQRTQLQAMTDSLTGLLNRRALEIEMHDLVRRGGEFSVIVADLDHFKRLNDTLGHQAGDHALRRFGEALKGSLRADDRAARWGGEEFVVLLVGTLALQAAEWVDRLRARLASELAQSGQPAFTSSFGIADSSMVRDAASLLRIADTALYMAKSRGRDRGSIGRPEFALGPDRRERDKVEAANGDAPPTAPQLTIARLRSHNESRG